MVLPWPFLWRFACRFGRRAGMEPGTNAWPLRSLENKRTADRPCPQLS
jgi:hypothetical protein